MCFVCHGEGHEAWERRLLSQRRQEWWGTDGTRKLQAG